MQFTFFTPANAFLLLYYVLYLSYEDENADFSLPLAPLCCQCPCESSMNRTEMTSVSENHKPYGILVEGGGEEGELNSDS